MPQDSRENRSVKQPQSGAGAPKTTMHTPGSAGKKVSGIGVVGGGFVGDDRHFNVDSEGAHVPTGNSEILITRRQLLYGAAGILGLAAVGGVATTVARESDSADTAESLSVAENEVFTLDGMSEVSADDVMSSVGEYKLPYGSLVWAGNDNVAACLLPSEKATPLVTADLLLLTTGNQITVLSAADGADDGFEIYDIRASEDGIIWTEANILTNVWRVFSAPLTDYEAGTHTQLDEGDASYEMPTLAVSGSRAYWQLIPVTSDDDSSETVQSVVKSVTFDSPKKASTVYTVDGSCQCALSIDNSNGNVIITAPNPDASSQCQILNVDSSGTVVDSLTFPSRMTPQEVAYGSTGFAFSFESIYNYGDGIANLGTYTSQSKPDNGAYSNRTWFRFERTPSMPPAWCDEWFIVKSTSAVVACDLASKRYAVFDTDNSAESYGDCLASIGQTSSVVIYTNIDRTESVSDSDDSTDSKYCLVRVFSVSGNDSGSSSDDGSDDYTDDGDYTDGGSYDNYSEE